MATAIVPFVVAVAGALAYGYASNGKVQELGRITFFVGMLWLVQTLATKVIHF